MATARSSASAWFKPAQPAVRDRGILRRSQPWNSKYKRVLAAPFRIPQWSELRFVTLAPYFPLAWKRLLTSAQLTTFHHSFR